MKLVFKNLISNQRHPDPRLQTYWDGFQIALLVIPFSSLLGSVAVSLISLILLQQRFRSIAQRPVNRGFAIVAGLMVISALLAYQKADAFLGLANFLPFFLIFAALSELIQTPAQLRRIAWIVVVTSVPIVLIGFGQLFWGWSGHVLILGSVVDWQIDPTGNPPGRMASIFFYANVLASYLGVSFILNLGLGVEAFISGRRTGNGGQGLGLAGGAEMRHTLYHRGFLTLAVLGNAIALILTDSRNVWAIALLACLAFSVYLGWRWILAGVVAIGGVVLGSAFAPSPMREGLRAIVPAFLWIRLTDQLYPNRPVETLRITQWRFACSLVEQRPWTGWGLRNFSAIYQEQMHLFIGHPHNLLLMLAAETGLPATLLFFGLVGWVIVKGSLLLAVWTGGAPKTNRPDNKDNKASSLSTAPCHPIPPSLPLSDRLIFFTYLTAFLGSALFNLLDITLFDVRINLMGWLLLAGICGIVYD
ncbi:MAG: O-antigen ligase family protein, partial [Kovacikia sp.]